MQILQDVMGAITNPFEDVQVSLQRIRRTSSAAARSISWSTTPGANKMGLGVISKRGQVHPLYRH